MPSNKTQKSPTNINSFDEPVSDLEHARVLLEQRFDTLRSQAESTTNVWERYEISILLKELKYIYEEIFKGGK